MTSLSFHWSAPTGIGLSQAMLSDVKSCESCCFKQWVDLVIVKSQDIQDAPLKRNFENPREKVENSSLFEGADPAYSSCFVILI